MNDNEQQPSAASPSSGAMDNPGGQPGGQGMGANHATPHHQQGSPFDPGLPAEPYLAWQAPAAAPAPYAQGHVWQQPWGYGFAQSTMPGPMAHPAYQPAGPAWQLPPSPYGYPPNPAAAATEGFSATMNNLAENSGLGALKDFLNLDDGEFWKGALVGAAAVLLITNEDLRGALIGGAAKTANAVKSGFSGLNNQRAGDEADGNNEEAEQ